MSEEFSTIPLIPSERDTVPVEAGRRVLLPPGAAAPRIHPNTNSIPLKSTYSTHSPLCPTPSVIEPLPHLDQFAESPVQLAPEEATNPQDLLEHSSLVVSDASRRGVLLHIFRKTSPWVLGGIVIMLLGIGLLRAAVLPHIFTCPVEATCAGSFDPSKGNTLQLLQSFTTYWIKIGLMVSSVGILKLAAYQAWFILMHQGNSVKNLDLNLGAIRGSITDTALLLLKNNNRLLSIFVFALLGIGAAINLIVGLSIVPGPGTQSVVFRYNASTQLPDNSVTKIGNDGQVKATERMITWALDNDQNHGGAFKGTLVTPDARSSQAVNAVPAGPTINAWFECKGWNNFTLPPQGQRGWLIWVNSTQFYAIPELSLAVSMYRTDTAVTEYLWVSNKTGLIPNATTIADGALDVAFCTHYFEMLPEKPRTQHGVQYLTPTVAQTSGCDSHANTSTCIADSVNNAVLNFWGGKGTSFWYISCRGGLLGTMSPTSDEERWCPITQELFKDTASGMLDAIIQTSPTSLPAIQELEANVSALNGSRWWLNVIIPAATLVLYIVVLAYTCVLSKGDQMLKELNLEEVLRAAQTDHMQNLVTSGRLQKTTPLRYHSDVGFVDNELKRSNS